MEMVDVLDAVVIDVGSGLRDLQSVSLLNGHIIDIPEDKEAEDGIRSVLMESQSSLSRQPEISDFEDFRELGTGAFGTTYSAYDKVSGNTLVLKKILKSRSPQDTVVQEIHILDLLQPICSEYILCFVNYFEDNDAYYIVTEFLGEYVTLLRYIREYHSTPDFKAIIADNMIRGLETIHERKIAHRDIKPENILINPENGNIKYIDFGLSCYQAECSTDTICGSPQYIDPFLLQNHGNEWTLGSLQKSDLWSLGLTIFELITGIDFYTARFRMYTLPNLERYRPDLVELFETSPEALETEMYGAYQRFVGNPGADPAMSELLPEQFQNRYHELYTRIVTMTNPDPVLRHL